MAVTDASAGIPTSGDAKSACSNGLCDVVRQLVSAVKVLSDAASPIGLRAGNATLRFRPPCFKGGPWKKPVSDVASDVCYTPAHGFCTARSTAYVSDDA